MTLLRIKSPNIVGQFVEHVYLMIALIVMLMMMMVMLWFAVGSSCLLNTTAHKRRVFANQISRWQITSKHSNTHHVPLVGAYVYVFASHSGEGA